MKVTDLTLPIQSNMNYYGTGQLPWEVSYKFEPTFPEGTGIKMGKITMYNEPGTRYLCVGGGKSLNDVFTKELDKRLFNVEAVKLKLPKEPKEGGNLISVDEIKRAIDSCPAKTGDAIILNTGHGDNEKYYKMGPKWEPQSPCMSPQAAPVLAAYLREMKANLFGYDTSNISWQCTNLVELDKTWRGLNPRPALESPEAKAIAEKYVLGGGFVREFGALVDLLNVTDAIGGLVNLGAVKADRFKLIIAPLKIVDLGYSAATIYAVED